MSPLNEGPVVKLLAGLLYPNDSPELRSWARGRLSEVFGELERESGQFDFGYTDYYSAISPALTRVFFSFAGLSRPSELVKWKKLAIGLEAESALDGGRRVNIDPGYVDGARVVLASTKDNAHRIYLSDGIYAEVTMSRRKYGWEKFSYTFPDFTSGVYDSFMDRVRLDWREDFKKNRRERS
jgi:hypothetical protein